MENVVVTFEPLIKKDSKEKLYNWSIFVENKEDHSVIVTEYGYTKKVTTVETINTGTNIGKKNEKNHFEHAVSKARSKWEKKRDLFNPPFALPMLVSEYTPGSNVKFPVFVQPKLDGYRMLYNTTTKILYTRTGKQMNLDMFKGVQQVLQNLPNGYILDGEFYSHNVPFEKLGVIRKQTVSEQDALLLDKIKYFVYDLIDTSKKYTDRKITLDCLNLNTDYTQILSTVVAKDHSAISQIHKTHLENSYEGSIIRIPDGLYRLNIRSKNLLKYKDFKDAEFEIVSFTNETCGLTNTPLVIWVIQINQHTRCSVRPKGTVEERSNLYKQCISSFDSLFKGSKLWVKFFEHTDDGNLRFPTTKTNSYTSYIRNIVE